MLCAMPRGERRTVLYYTTDDETFPDARRLASEPLTESGIWQSVPEHQILILSPEEPPELLSL